MPYDMVWLEPTRWNHGPSVLKFRLWVLDDIELLWIVCIFNSDVCLLNMCVVDESESIGKKVELFYANIVYEIQIT